MDVKGIKARIEASKLPNKVEAKALNDRQAKSQVSADGDRVSISATSIAIKEDLQSEIITKTDKADTESAEERAARVAKLAQRVRSGEYRIDSEALASAFQDKVVETGEEELIAAVFQNEKVSNE